MAIAKLPIHSTHSVSISAMTSCTGTATAAPISIGDGGCQFFHTAPTTPPTASAMSRLRNGESSHVKPARVDNQRHSKNVMNATARA